jgi:hypothetical protein
MRSAVVIAVMLLAAASAEAAPRFKPIGEGRVMADGNRWALLQLEGQPARVIDDLRGRSWEVPVPSPMCTAIGVAAANVLWSCPGVDPQLQQAQTGALRPVPGWDAYERWFAEFAAFGWVGSPPYPSGLGSRWVRGSALCYHCAPMHSYMDWRTGRFVEPFEERANRVVDLDEPELEVKLCRPLHRVRDRALGMDQLAPARYDAPWLLERTEPYPSLRLYRCGQRRPVVSRRCGRSCDAILGGGFLTWLEWPRVRALRLADGRRFRLGQPAGGSIQRTRRTIYINAYPGTVLARAMPPRAASR